MNFYMLSMMFTWTWFLNLKVGKGLLLWCGFFSVQGVNDGIHLDILKPKGAFVEDYYYHKIKGYSIITQVVIKL